MQYDDSNDMFGTITEGNTATLGPFVFTEEDGKLKAQGRPGFFDGKQTRYCKIGVAGLINGVDRDGKPYTREELVEAMLTAIKREMWFRNDNCGFRLVYLLDGVLHTEAIGYVDMDNTDLQLYADRDAKHYPEMTINMNPQAEQVAGQDFKKD